MVVQQEDIWTLEHHSKTQNVIGGAPISHYMKMASLQEKEQKLMKKTMYQKHIWRGRKGLHWGHVCRCWYPPAKLRTIAYCTLCTRLAYYYIIINTSVWWMYSCKINIHVMTCIRILSKVIKFITMLQLTINHPHLLTSILFFINTINRTF